MYKRQGWSTNAAYGGFHILARKTDGGYYALAHIEETTAGDHGQRVYWLELDSNFAVISKQIIHEGSGKEPHSSIYSEYTDITHAPIVDLIRKKVYMTTYYYNESSSQHIHKLIHIDLSDVWDQIDEFNKLNWIIGATKIATQLTLQISPL